jgi:cytochrome c peroxidase
VCQAEQLIDSSLCKVLVTAPYFHDGSQEMLWDVMVHYNQGRRDTKSVLDEDVQPLAR